MCIFIQSDIQNRVCLRFMHAYIKVVFCATHRTLIQESIAELNKLLLGLFSTEAPEEVCMEVTQLKDETRTEDQH